MRERDFEEYVARLESRIQALEEMHTHRWPEGECAPEDHEWERGQCVKCGIGRQQYDMRPVRRWREHPWLSSG